MICFHAIFKTEIKVSILNYYCCYAFFLSFFLPFFFPFTEVFFFVCFCFCPFLISLEMPPAFHGSQNNSSSEIRITYSTRMRKACVVKVSHMVPLLFI